jgi:hypothetical protein
MVHRMLQSVHLSHHCPTLILVAKRLGLETQRGERRPQSMGQVGCTLPLLGEVVETAM